MSSDDADAGKPATNRRTLLKGISGAMAVTALGAGAASADADAQDCGWEYNCQPVECPQGGAGTLLRRYCCNGSCSGWETDGCCAYP